MNEFLDLLPIPAERNFPPGRLETRRDALVAAIGTEETREPLTRRARRAARGAWLSLLGILALAVALVCTGLSAPHRPAQSGAVALLAVTVATQVAAPLRLSPNSRH